MVGQEERAMVFIIDKHRCRGRARQAGVERRAGPGPKSRGRARRILCGAHALTRGHPMQRAHSGPGQPRAGLQQELYAAGVGEARYLERCHGLAAGARCRCPPALGVLCAPSPRIAAPACRLSVHPFAGHPVTCWRGQGGRRSLQRRGHGATGLASTVSRTRACAPTRQALQLHAQRECILCAAGSLVCA